MRFQFIDDKILGLIMMEMLVKEQSYIHIESYNYRYVLCIDCDNKELTWFGADISIEQIKSYDDSEISLQDLLLIV